MTSVLRLFFYCHRARALMLLSSTYGFYRQTSPYDTSNWPEFSLAGTRLANLNIQHSASQFSLLFLSFLLCRLMTHYTNVGLSISYFIQYHIKTKDRCFHLQGSLRRLNASKPVSGWYQQTPHPSKQEGASVATHPMVKTPFFLYSRCISLLLFSPDLVFSSMATLVWMGILFR